MELPIAYLAWGSLVWDPRALPIRGQWFKDGPFLPVEFARKSTDGRLTLVLVQGCALVRTLWVPCSLNDIRKACEALREREYIPKDKAAKYIRYWNGGEQKEELTEQISQWAGRLGISSVIWTDLPANFGEKKDRAPTREEVTSYLANLPYEKRKNAERYIRMAPRQIDTEYHREIELKFGWTSVGEI